MLPHPLAESHRTDRIGWLRAAVLGANDGIISTSSLMLGVAAASSNPREVFVAGVAGLMAGAVSMAAGEYVSVSSQADSERAEVERERRELADDPDFEHAELAAIYVKRGLDQALADQVATRLTAVDALGAHARDELGLSETMSARPVQAGLASAASFAVGAALPLVVAATVPAAQAGTTIAVSSLVLLFGLGALAAKVGGAPPGRAAWRVTFWGALAMGLTALVGWVFGLAV
ncbi:MAG: VIT family protein [Vicinamibacterales bacterium]|jgi:VIT1/CCC1 family predicted Fe2+/Mn2+ transporter